MQVPTMKVKNPKGEGYWIVNEADFDPEKYEIWDEGSSVEAPVADEVDEDDKPKTRGRKKAE